MKHAIAFSFVLLFCQSSTILSQNIDSLKRIINSDSCDSTKASTSYKLATSYYNSNTDSSVLFYSKCLELAQDENLKFKASNGLAYLYLDVSNYSKAQDYLLECLKIANEKNDSLLILTSNSNLGNLYIQIELNDKTIYHLKKASEYINENKYPNEAGKLYGRLGNFYLYQNYYNEAEENYKKAITAFEKAKNLKGIIIATQNLGVIEKRRRNYSKAIDYYNQALKSYESIGYEIGEGQCLANIGNIHTENKEYRLAYSHLVEALKLFKKTRQVYDEVVCYSEIVELFQNQNDYPKAIEFALKAKNLLDSLPENDQTRLLVLSQLHSIYKNTGNINLAYQYLSNYQQLNDSLNKSKLNDKIESLKIQYEVEQKDKNLKLLTLENELKDAKIKRKSIFQIFYLITIGLSVLVIISLYILFRIKITANNELVIRNSKILQQKEEIEAQREEIEAQRDDLEIQRGLAINQRDEIIRQKKNITDSIAYAEHIQTAMLPNKNEIIEVIPNSFVFFKPLDIVSGDFYWVNKSQKNSIVAVADCTGHGVPGAFMSIMGINLLNTVIVEQEVSDPGEVLNRLNHQVIAALSHTDNNLQDKDGMDISVCSIDTESLLMKYSSAKIKVLICRDGKVIQLEADKYSIGKSPLFEKISFLTRSFQLNKSDMIYLMTDGYTDQFGGKERTKFLSSRFKKMVLEIADLSISDQKRIIKERIEEWQGSFPQVDDMLIVGIRV